MGVMQGVALGAKNEALLMLKVSTRTMVMATNVLITMFIARACRVEEFGRDKVLAALMVATGGILQGVAHMEAQLPPYESDKPEGYLLALMALVLDGSRWILLQAMVTREAAESKEEEESCVGYMPPSMGSPCTDPRASAILDVKRQLEAQAASSAGRAHEAGPFKRLRMVATVMWSSAPVMLVLSLVFEKGVIALAFKDLDAIFRTVAFLSAGVMGINVCEFCVVQTTSAVTFTVLSNLHSIPLVLSGIICFGEQVKAMQIAGFGVCLIGSLMYSRAKAAEAKPLRAR